MNRVGRVLLVLALLYQGGCAKPVPEYEKAPVARCGMAPYKLVDPATLGDVTAYTEVQELNLDVASVQSLLTQTGYTPLPQVSYGSRVFQYRYTTQDRGQRIEATAVLAVPANATIPDRPFPTAVFLHGTTGFADPCAPSRSTSNDAAGTLLAALGLVTILPDYIGMNGMGAPSTSPHGYLVAEQVGIGSWDAVRAGHKLLEQLRLGVSVDDRVVVWGGSQGGHAAMFVEQWGPYYAPEFTVPGVVALVAPTTLLPLARDAVTSWSPPTLAFASVMTTWQRWYGQPSDLTGVLTNDPPYDFASTIDAQVYVQDTCDTGSAYSALTSSTTPPAPSVVFQESFTDNVLDGYWEGLGPWGCEIQENSLASTSVKPLRHTPTFMAYSQDDTLVVTAPMRSEFEHLCSLGYQLHYEECIGAAHTDGAIWSLPDQISWVQDRLAGKPPTDMCVLHDPVCCPATPASTCTR
jgi:hypothetical protein